MSTNNTVFTAKRSITCCDPLSDDINNRVTIDVAPGEYKLVVVKQFYENNARNVMVLHAVALESCDLMASGDDEYTPVTEGCKAEPVTLPIKSGVLAFYADGNDNGLKECLAQCLEQTTEDAPSILPKEVLICPEFVLVQIDIPDATADVQVYKESGSDNATSTKLQFTPRDPYAGIAYMELADA